MVNQSNKVLNKNITKLVNKTYQYGFSTDIEKDIIEKGLTEQTVKLISQKKREPKFLLEFRLKAYKMETNDRARMGLFKILTD